MSDEALAPEDVTPVYDQTLVAACKADLERLLPQWQTLPEDERQWQIQRFLDQLEALPDLQRTFNAVILQRIIAHDRYDAPEPYYELLSDLRHALALMQ
jgi:hypothetical protein